MAYAERVVPHEMSFRGLGSHYIFKNDWAHNKEQAENQKFDATGYHIWLHIWLPFTPQDITH